MASDDSTSIANERVGATVATEPPSYDPRFFTDIAAVEDRHFWFVARNRVIDAAVGRIVSALQPGYRVLEVGCGTGIVLEQLSRSCVGGEVLGMDLYPEAVAMAQRRCGCRVIVGDVFNPPDIGDFDIVGLFDVLEHLSDDRAILNGLHRMLRPNGVLLLSVPAHMSLWSYFDTSAGHRRRYQKEGLSEKLRAAGFEIEYITEFMMMIFPLVWALRSMRRDDKMNNAEAADKAATELKLIPGLNGLLKYALGLETIAIRRRRQLPLGTSLLAIARKVQR